MVQLTDKHICFELPAYYYELQIKNGELIWVDEKGFGHFVSLPPGSWQYLFTTKEATEKDAIQIVRSCQWHFPEPHIRFVDYAYPFDYENKQRWGEGFSTALESLQSLLKSKGCDTSKNHAILKSLQYEQGCRKNS